MTEIKVREQVPTLQRFLDAYPDIEPHYVSFCMPEVHVTLLPKDFIRVFRGKPFRLGHSGCLHLYQDGIRFETSLTGQFLRLVPFEPGTPDE